MPVAILILLITLIGIAIHRMKRVIIPIRRITTGLGRATSIKNK